MPGGLQLFAELGEVLDDPVVDDEDAPAAVGVRVSVDVRRAAVGRPAGVPDAEMPVRHVLVQPGDQVVDLGLGLGDARARPFEDGHACRVIPAVLEALEAVHEDRRGLAVTEVADDPAHPV